MDKGRIVFAGGDLKIFSSVLIVSVLTLIFASLWFARKWYLARRLKRYGIGKGAPGFQTSVSRVRVTPEVALRLQRGENVSPEEVQKAVEEMARRQAAESGDSTTDTSHRYVGVVEVDHRSQTNASESEETDNSQRHNEWLPEHLKRKAKGAQKRKGKKR